MSRIDQLIELLCPDGVEFKKMGKVGEFVRGNGLQKTDFTTEGVGCIHYGQIYTYYGTFTDKTKSFVSEELSKKLKKVAPNDLVIASTSENLKDVCKSVAWLGDNEIVTGGHATIFKHRENPKYLSYLTQSELFYEQKVKYAKGIKVIDVSAKDMAKFCIPVPPLEIQNEIVDILDNFTYLEEELEEELEARRAQYEHYRDDLLSFETKNVEWKTLGEICISSTSGGTPLATKAEYYLNGTIPWLRTQEVRFNEIYSTALKITEKALAESSAKWIPPNCVIIAISGATAGRSAINKISLTTNQHCCNLVINPKIASYRFVFHWVSSRYQQLKSMGQGARSDLNSGIIKSFPIPIPHVTEQERIVSILDKFDALVNDISSGLPAEIEARRKQYEFYRNKLLTFKKRSDG